MVRHEPQIVEHGTSIKQFRVELKSTPVACECAEIVNTAGMVEEQLCLCVPNEFRNLLCELRVRNADTRDGLH
jgi:hypothetical protein